MTIKENVSSRPSGSRTRRFVTFFFGTLLLYTVLAILSLVNHTNEDADVHETYPREEAQDISISTGGGRQLSEVAASDSDNTFLKSDQEQLDVSESLSSCVMVMDDNHLLVEWIAYHYFVMNMRYLVVLPDPKSRFSPDPVLDRWREYMTIVKWTDETFMDEDHTQKSLVEYRASDSKKDEAQWHHNFRQNEFLRQCAIHMKENGKKWASFHDVDEYYVINSQLVKDSVERMQDPGGGMKMFQEIVGFLQPLYDMAGIMVSKHYIGPCVTTYRTIYGAVESTKEEIARNVPEFLDPRRFETLRWRQHKTHKDPQDGKSLLDVSRIDLATLQSPDSFTRPHELLPTCPGIFYHTKAFLRINHYIGNWAYYSFRKNDKRAGVLKNRSRWSREASKQGGGYGDEARPWIGGFVRYFGQEEAGRLLENCGLNPDFVGPLDVEWLLPADTPGNSATLKRMNKDMLLKEKKINAAAGAVCDGWSECANPKPFR
jgi:hypothetical protein